jgi:shikimate kinase
MIRSEPNEDASLMREAVFAVLRHFKLSDTFGAYVETDSNIPIAKGLKSSSTAANAIVLATIGALGKEVDDETVLNLAVDAAINARTTITGAFDDACASFFGNIVVTDNVERKVLERFDIAEDLLALFHIPPQKSYTYTSNVARMKLIAPQVEVAFREALAGNCWTALTLNGALYSTALGYEGRLAIDAVEAGALASGLSGKGPATVAIVSRDHAREVKDAWRPYGGDVIDARINKERARVTRRS